MSQGDKGKVEFTKILQERARIEQQKRQKVSDEKNNTWMNRVFGFTKKMAPDDIPDIDIKGQRHRRQDSASMPKTQIERQLYRIESGPKMLPRKQRFRAWFGLSMLLAWFGGCYALISYRLRADDLELMEREVYEDLAKKKEVERLQRDVSLDKHN